MRLALAALLALAPAAARAADVPGSRATRATLTVGGSAAGNFEVANDSDWYRVKLLAGHDYALGVSTESGGIALALRNAAGRVLAQKDTVTEGGEDDGLEFRAPYTGAYYVSAQLGGSSEPFPVWYGVWIMHDCLASPRTACTLAVGQTRRAATASGADKDWFATTLKAGVAYDITLAVDGLEHCAVVRDARGVLLTAIYAACADFGSATIAGFTPPKGGAYFVEVAPDDNTGSGYGVSLARR